MHTSLINGGLLAIRPRQVPRAGENAIKSHDAEIVKEKMRRPGAAGRALKWGPGALQPAAARPQQRPNNVRTGETRNPLGGSTVMRQTTVNFIADTVALVNLILLGATTGATFILSCRCCSSSLCSSTFSCTGPGSRPAPARSCCPRAGLHAIARKRHQMNSDRSSKDRRWTLSQRA